MKCHQSLSELVQMFKDPQRYKLNHIKPIKLTFLSASWTSLNLFNNAIVDGVPQYDSFCPFSRFITLFFFVFIICIRWMIHSYVPSESTSTNRIIECLFRTTCIQQAILQGDSQMVKQQPWIYLEKKPTVSPNPFSYQKNWRNHSILFNELQASWFITL